MKITPMASEFVGILASVVKTSLGYMTYIGGCVSKSRIVKLTALTRHGFVILRSLNEVLVVYVMTSNVYGLGTTLSGNQRYLWWELTVACIRFCKLGTTCI